MNMKIFSKKQEPLETRGKADLEKFMPWHLKALRVYERDRLQKLVIVSLCGLCALLTIGTFNNRSEVQTVIVRTNSDGAPISAVVADASELPEIQEREIERVLINISEWWRIKTTDKQNERRQYARLFAHLTEPARRKILRIIENGNLYPWIRLSSDEKYDPIRDTGEFTADVELLSINKLGDAIWQLRYRETAFDSNGTEIAKYTIVATYTVQQLRPTSTKTVRRNPFGLFVSDLSASLEGGTTP